MKFRKIRYCGIATAILVAAASCAAPAAQNIVLLHTNDTHSSIDPDKTGAGGILQRKAVIDSVRRAEKNTLLIDAGDMVQGSLYFRFFKGDVEYPLMNMMGYDIRILGNHEFDNGMESLAKYYKDVNCDRLSANYDLSATPLKGMLKPYVIKKIGGRKIGFIGINVNPESVILEHNSKGLVYKDVITVANEYARKLKHDDKCDMVVVVSHIGVEKDGDKPTDYDLARSSRDIDIIIGGHSHSLIRPDGGKFPSRVKNLDGRDVLVAQAGKYGKYIGRIEIDTKRIAAGADAVNYSLIPVTDRFDDSQLDRKMTDFLRRYRHDVDSVNARVVAVSARNLSCDDRNGGFANWTADCAFWYGRHKLDSLTHGTRRLDIGMMNVGGIRHDMPAGNVSEGDVLNTFPFSNYMVIMEIKGSDFVEAMKVAARKGGEAVSGNVRVVTDGNGNVVRVVVDDREIDPDRIYTLSTINFVAEGKDDLTSMARGKVIWRDDVEMIAPLMRYVQHFTELGLPIDPDPNGRFVSSIGMK